MNLKIQNTVVMVYNVTRDIRIKLDDVVKNKKTEQLIMENLRRCRYFAGKNFGLILWNEKLEEKKVKDFFKRHQELLFLLNTKITKKFNRVWFLIDDDFSNDESKYRYKWNGSILEGLVKYNEMINHMNHREKNDESSNRR